MEVLVVRQEVLCQTDVSVVEHELHEAVGAVVGADGVRAHVAAAHA